MRDGAPKWFAQWLAQQVIEKQDDDLNAYLTEEWELAAEFISAVDFSFMSLGLESGPFLDDVRSALITAYEANEPWLRSRAPPGMPFGHFWLDLKRRAAARWLLSNPMYQHLVPPEWARVVLKDGKPEPEERVTNWKAEGRPRGPKPKTRERVIEEMRRMASDKIGQVELSAMKQEQMRVTFGASRETCQRAREEVLLNFVGVSSADK